MVEGVSAAVARCCALAMSVWEARRWVGFVTKRVVKGAGRGSEVDVVSTLQAPPPASPPPLPLRLLRVFQALLSFCRGFVSRGGWGLRLSEWQGGREVLDRGP